MPIITVPDKLPKPSGRTGYQFSKEECSRGGKVVSPTQVLARNLMNRKKCSVKCAFFEQCPVNALALGYVDPKTGEKGQCLMKSFPETVRQQFINLFLTGEEGVIHAIKVALHNYMVDVDAYGTLRDKRDMVQLMLQFYKEVYNAQRQKGVTKEPLTITIRRVGMAPETMEINPRAALPDGITVKDLTADQNQDETEGDPESLMNSPIIETLIRPIARPIPGTLMMEEIKIESNIERLLND